MTDVEWVVGRLELRVADRLCSLLAVDDPALRAAAALAVAAPRGGHVCLDLAQVTTSVVGPDGEIVLADPPEGRAWAAALGASPLARAGDDAARTTPVVVHGTRAYLDRYWTYENLLHDLLVDRSADVPGPADPARVRGVLDAVAAHDPPRPGDPVADRQRLAVANALLRPLSVLSGGPGTGKTHTIVSLLAGHVLLAEARGQRAPRIRIAAPTGKAAARMGEAVHAALGERGFPPSVRAALGELRGETLHRLLGHLGHTPSRFRHDATDPLDADVVVVDEASMVPLSLMAKLVAAVRPSCTLVLVGDRDQLTSVEAGAVLGDVCGPRSAGSTLRVSDGWAAILSDVTGEAVETDRTAMATPGVWDGIVQLERFRRFGRDTGIGAVARAVQRVDDDADEVVDLLAGRTVEVGAAVDRYPDVTLVAPAGNGLPQVVAEAVLDDLAPYLDAVADGDAAAALRAVDLVRVLCATRTGPQGVAEVVADIEARLAGRGRLRPVAGAPYPGRPVLVTRNDYDLGVMNGDVGVTLEVAGRLVVAFPDARGEVDAVRLVPALRVQDCETVWAMTIHKSQGSQFDHTVVVLPVQDTRVLSRELLYTAVTRARDRVTVVATEQRVAEAVLHPVRRATGLADRLWPAPDAPA
jgi:exodeoxyribonuclease V alpha subunit